MTLLKMQTNIQHILANLKHWNLHVSMFPSFESWKDFRQMTLISALNYNGFGNHLYATCRFLPVSLLDLYCVELGKQMCCPLRPKKSEGSVGWSENLFFFFLFSFPLWIQWHILTNDRWHMTNNNIYIIQFFRKPQLLQELRSQTYILALFDVGKNLILLKPAIYRSA